MIKAYIGLTVAFFLTVAVAQVIGTAGVFSIWGVWFLLAPQILMFAVAGIDLKRSWITLCWESGMLCGIVSAAGVAALDGPVIGLSFWAAHLLVGAIYRKFVVPRLIIKEWAQNYGPRRDEWFAKAFKEDPQAAARAVGGVFYEGS